MVFRVYTGVSCTHLVINKLLSCFRFSFLIVMISMVTACSSGGGDDTSDTNSSVTYYQDADNDGYGNPAITQLATSQPAGYILDNTDCNDSSAADYPGATEISDGIDNNCDGQIDEGNDTVPDAFIFTDQTDVATSSVATSNVITIAGINAPAAISVVGGEYSINGAAYTALAGTVSNTNKVTVRHTSSGNNLTIINTTLTVGGISDTFSSTTTAQAIDDIPDQFTFDDQTNVPTNVLVTSNTITVTDVNTMVNITISGGEYSLNGGSFTSASGTVVVDDTVKVRHTSSASHSSITNTMLAVGSISDVFSTTTDTTPYALFPTVPDYGLFIKTPGFQVNE